MKKTLSLAALALVAFVGLTGFRGGCGRPDHKDPAQVAAFVTARLDDALDDVDATPAQRTQIQAIKDRLLQRFQAQRADRQATHATLLAEWKAEKVDRAKVLATLDERAAAMKAMATEAADALIEVHDLLTPAQREKLAKKAERMHSMH